MEKPCIWWVESHLSELLSAPAEETSIGGQSVEPRIDSKGRAPSLADLWGFEIS